jgi:glutathione S-transferase
MTDFTLHGIPGSPYVRAVALALEEKAARWRFEAVPMGGHRAPEYRAIHPFHKIPTLDHGDFRLYETAAILRYIDRAVPGASLVPAESKREARMDQLISMTNDYIVSRVSAVLSFNRRIAPMLGLSVDEEAVRNGIGPARDTIAEFVRLLGDAPYMTGDTLSLADLMVVSHVSFLPEYAEGRDLMGAHPSLMAWLMRMGERPSMTATTWDSLIALTGVNTKAPSEPVAA